MIGSRRSAWRGGNIAIEEGEKRPSASCGKRRARHARAEQAAVHEAFRKDALIAHAKAELEWMELEEEARVIEKQAFRARANLRKVALYGQGKGMDELQGGAISASWPSHDAGGGLFSIWAGSDHTSGHRRGAAMACAAAATASAASAMSHLDDAADATRGLARPFRARVDINA